MNILIITAIGRPFLRSLFILLAFVSITLLPKAQAVVPAPDGGYPGGNTAEGRNALFRLTTGGYNTAVGWSSLKSLTTGSFNTGTGAGALVSTNGDPTVGEASQNTATGAGALLSNTTGGFNTATGAFAAFSNTTGFDNTAIGDQSLTNNTTGGFNTAIGDSALAHNTTGHSNTAVGGGAGGNITTASNVICIGAGVPGANVDNSCFVGNIYGQSPFGSPLAVYIDSQGQLGTMASSRRLKKDIKRMDDASEAILSLKPVSFRYKAHNDTTPQFGLIAEEVAQVNPALVVRDKEGKPYSVRYDQINAMLLNEFLKEHRNVEELCASDAEQKKEIAEQRKEIRTLTAQLKEQATQIQKVSAQMEMSRPVLQMALNP